MLYWFLLHNEVSQPHVYIYPLPFKPASNPLPLSHASRSSQKAKLSSLYYTAGSHWLSYILHPWDFPSKNTGVGCRFLLHIISFKCRFILYKLIPGLWTVSWEYGALDGSMFLPFCMRELPVCVQGISIMHHKQKLWGWLGEFSCN